MGIILFDGDNYGDDILIPTNVVVLSWIVGILQLHRSGLPVKIKISWNTTSSKDSNGNIKFRTATTPVIGPWIFDLLIT